MGLNPKYLATLQGLATAHLRMSATLTSAHNGFASEAQSQLWAHTGSLFPFVRPSHMLFSWREALS